MTTTTADWSGSTVLKLTPLALAAMLMSNECRADWKVVPVITLSETYSDNVNNETDDLKHGAFITESSPSVSVIGNGARFKLNGEAEWHSYKYGSDVSNARNSDRRYQVNAQAIAVKDLLFVDGNASSSRQAISAFGPLPGNSYSSNNSANISTWSISPYLRHRFGSTALMTLRYTRDSVSGGDGYGFGNSTASTRAADVISGPAYTTVTWNLHYTHQDLGSANSGDTVAENSLAGVQWNVLPHLGLTGTVGYDDYEYPVLNQATKGASWTTGFVWTPSTHTSVQASFGRRYFGKTGSLISSFRTRHTTWSLNYIDAITTTRQQFLLPASVDTAATLNTLFASTYPDPIQRAQAVQAYIASTGLPASLANNINFLSNRYQRQKRLQAQVGLRGARSDLMLSVFKQQSQGVSLQQEDSALLPSQLSSLNDNTRQSGANANFNYQLSSRSSAQASIYAVRSQSISSDISNNYVTANAGVFHHFDKQISGSLNLRHSSGRASALNSGDYHENAIVATLSVQY